MPANSLRRLIIVISTLTLLAFGLLWLMSSGPAAIPTAEFSTSSAMPETTPASLADNAAIASVALNTNPPINDVPEILVCEVSQSTDTAALDINVLMEEAVQSHVSLVMQMSGSPEPEVQTLTEVLSPTADVTDHLTRLAALSDDFPDDALVALHLLNACRLQAGNAVCGDSLTNRVTRLAGSNASSWLLIASLEYSRANPEAAAVALQQAADAPEFDDYFRRHLSLLRSFVVDGTDSRNSIGRAIGIAASVNLIGKNMQPLIEFCSDNVQSIPGLANSCLAFGARLQDESSNLLNAKWGAALRSSVHLSLGDAATSVAIEMQDQDAFDRLFNADVSKAFALADFDSRLLDNWFDYVVANGELAAVPYIVSEARGLSADPAYNPCP